MPTTNVNIDVKIDSKTDDITKPISHNGTTYEYNEDQHIFILVLLIIIMDEH